MDLATTNEDQQERLDPASTATARTDPAPVTAVVMVGVIGIVGIHMPVAYEC
jgi:hypothetical protein